jgi:hypothetical protein
MDVHQAHERRLAGESSEGGNDAFGEEARAKTEVRDTSRRTMPWEDRVAGVRITPAATTD